MLYCMKTIADLIKEARARAGMSQEDLVLEARRRNRKVSLRVLSKLESGGSCRINTVKAVYECIPRPDRGDWAEWMTAVLSGSARMYDAHINIGEQKASSRTETELVRLIDGLPKATKEGIAELLKHPAGVRLINGTVRSFELLRETAKKSN